MTTLAAHVRVNAGADAASRRKGEAQSEPATSGPAGVKGLLRHSPRIDQAKVIEISFRAFPFIFFS